MHIILFLSFIFSYISISVLSIFTVQSRTIITKSDSSMCLILFCTPIFSITFLDFLIPAVSVSITGIPSIYSISSIASLVVPGMCVTIAFSFFARAFKRLDLPTFGLPAITIFKPFFIISPRFSSSINVFISPVISSIFSLSFS